MAEGYDNRPAGRASFAFSPEQPYQSRTSGGGQSRGADVRGGNTQGGVERATPITAPTDSGIPEFLQGVMEPYIQRKQQEQFFKGLTAAQSGQALDEIHRERSGPLSTLLGPDHYEQGAAAYTAQTRLNQWGAKLTADKDNLKKLPPEELSKVFAAASEELMTGNPIADAAIQQGIVQQSGPLVDTITKERVAWQRATRNKSHAEMTDSASEGYEGLASAQAALNGPSEEGASALAVAEGNFLAQYQQPADMADEDYQTFLYNSARNMLATGKFRSFNAIEKRGLLKVGGALKDEQIIRLDMDRDTQGLKALGEAALDPEIVTALEVLHADKALGRIKSPLEASARLQDINAMLARKTGVSWVRLFDHKAVVGEGNDVTNAAVAAARRIEDRKWQVEDREDAQAFQIEQKEREAAQRGATASTFAASGQMGTALAIGLVDEKDANVVFGNAITKGDFGLLARNFERGGTTNRYGASIMQAGVAASEGVGLTGGFQHTHEQWKALDKLSPAAAMSYMGRYAARMEAYDNAVQRGDTAVSAYAQTFGKPASAVASLPPGMSQSVAMKAAEAVVRDSEGGMLVRAFGGGRQPLSTGGAQALARWIVPQAANYSNVAGIPFEAAAAKFHKEGLATGKIERAGPLGWQNAMGQVPLTKLLRQPDDSIDEAVTALADEKLKATGVAQGINDPALWVQRVADRGKLALLYIHTTGPDGQHHDTFITSDEVRSWLTKRAAGEVHANQPGAKGGFVSIDSASNKARSKSYVGAYQAGGATDVAEVVKGVGAAASSVVGVAADYAAGGPLARSVARVRQRNKARRAAAKTE